VLSWRHIISPSHRDYARSWLKTNFLIGSRNKEVLNASRNARTQNTLYIYIQTEATVYPFFVSICMAGTSSTLAITICEDKLLCSTKMYVISIWPCSKANTAYVYRRQSQAVLNGEKESIHTRQLLYTVSLADLTSCLPFRFNCSDEISRHYVVYISVMPRCRLPPTVFV
jgi:hypothetical protein